MGTYFSLCYPETELLVEQENLLHPDRVKAIHLEYLKSGARLIRTNTFAVNSSFFGDRKEREDHIRAGYRIAKEAVRAYKDEMTASDDRHIFIAADIGTIFDHEMRDRDSVLREYQEILDSFLDEGAEIFLFETQSDLFYLEDVIRYLKEKKPDAFVMLSFSFDKNGYTKAGMSLERMVERVANMPEVEAYGMNCGVEGNHMYQLLERITFPNEKYLIAMPNAGYPVVLRGKTIYGKNLPYFLQMEEKIYDLGADIVGGCCGTTPEYIEGICKCLDQSIRHPKKIGHEGEKKIARTESEFWKKLQRGEKPFVVELDPPFDLQTKKVIDGAKLLKEHRVDLLTLSDSPMARVRMDASLLSSKVQREAGIPVMPHLSCRDRNVISLRGTLLGDYDNDIKHFLIVTGDPVAQCDRSTITQVFDFNSIKLMGVVQEMNEDIFAADKVVYGGALNYHGVNPEAIARRMELKMERGCSYFLTQPVYSTEDVERLAWLRERTGAKIIAGIMPLVSYRNAMFIANEMPGVHIPEPTISAYDPDMSREEAEEVAVRLSVELAGQLADVSDGYYFMTPFNRVSLICRIIEKVRQNGWV